MKTHMNFYYAPSTQRFQMRVPSAFDQSIKDFLAYKNFSHKTFKSKTDVILYAVSVFLKSHDKAVQAHKKKTAYAKKKSRYSNETLPLLR